MPARPPAERAAPDPDRIPARNDSEARARFLKFINRSLQTVHASACWRTAPVLRAEGEHSAITVPEVVPLRRHNGESLHLKAMMRFTYGDDSRYSGERKVNTLEYAYTLTDDPSLERALFAWEWNPASEVWSDPHVHVSRGDAGARGYGKQHIPTGRVAFEHVLKFAVLQHGVATQVPQSEAIQVLDDVLGRFHRHKTW